VRFGEAIGIDWAVARFGLGQLRMGLELELEHGRRVPPTNVSDTTRSRPARSHSHLTEFRTISVASRGWKPKLSANGRNATRAPTV
jgi:Protein of unknown function (DUF5661)